jgi:NAD(P)-dependent dehydrogenase (short-subunit alcohol dehydrogenase family)
VGRAAVGDRQSAEDYRQPNRVADWSDVEARGLGRTDLAGFFHITQHAIRQMVTQSSGHIVNITASLVDHASSTSPSALASLTTGGLDAATRSLATEYRGAKATGRPACAVVPTRGQQVVNRLHGTRV